MHQNWQTKFHTVYFKNASIIKHFLLADETPWHTTLAQHNIFPTLFSSNLMVLLHQINSHVR